MEWSIDRLIAETERLGARGLPRTEFFAELAPRLRNVIDNDASCWHTLDPHTRMLTSDSPEELIDRGIFAPQEAAAAGELIVRSEYLVDDLNTFASLAARRVPVGILAHSARGKLEQSPRYRDLLEPAGIPHELRAAFVIRGRVWGAVHVARRAASGAFTEREAAALARLAGPIAHGIRASLRFDAARRVAGVEPPGLVVLGPTDEIELITPPAQPLLASMRSEATVPRNEALASPVLALAGFIRRTPPTGHGEANAVTVPGREGWVTLHASLPGDPGDGRVAIVLERASAAQSATVRLEASGATPREREVATLLARGLSNAEIADTLVLSRHTVTDHVKSLYEKVSVTSRQELVARVFLDEYLPDVVRQTPLTSRGRFDRE